MEKHYYQPNICCIIYLAFNIPKNAECREWSESRSVVSDSVRPHGLYSPWNSPGQNTGVGSRSLLQLNAVDSGKSYKRFNEIYLLNFLEHGKAKTFWESLGLQGDLTSPS